MKDTNIIFRISADMKEKFAAKCKSEGKPVSEVLNGRVSSYLGVKNDFKASEPKKVERPIKRTAKRPSAKDSTNRVNLSDFGI